MVATLCDGMDTLGMVATPIKDSQEVLFNQPLINQIFVGDILVDCLHVDLLVSPFVDGLLVGRILVGRSLVNQPFVGQPPFKVVPPWHAIVTNFRNFQHAHPSIKHGFYLV